MCISRRVLYYAAIGMVFMRGIINVMGVVIYGVFSDCDPLRKYGKTPEPALVVVNYVLTVLPKIPGLAGLFVAAIYAAVLR